MNPYCGLIFRFDLGPQAGGVMVLNITLFMFTGKQLVNRYTCLSVVLIINIYIYIYIYTLQTVYKINRFVVYVNSSFIIKTHT